MLKWVILTGLASVALNACTEINSAASRSGQGSKIECGGPGQPACQFFDGPFQLADQPRRLPTRKAVFYPLARPLGFVDSTNARWRAPDGTLTDGASIPPIFHSVIGNPLNRQFAQGAALHDAYCGIGNENQAVFQTRDWRDVHRMFYDGLRVGGTSEIRAKIMFAAVWLGGPRWGDIGRDLSTRGVLPYKLSNNDDAVGSARVKSALKRNLAPYAGKVPEGGMPFQQDQFGGVRYDSYERDLSGVPVHHMRRILRDAIRFIRHTKPTPSIDEIIVYLEYREYRLLDNLVGRQDGEERIQQQPIVTEAPQDPTPPAPPVTTPTPTPPVTTPTPTPPVTTPTPAPPVTTPPPVLNVTL